MSSLHLRLRKLEAQRAASLPPPPRNFVFITAFRDDEPPSADDRTECKTGELLRELPRATPQERNGNGANQHAEVSSDAATKPPSPYRETLQRTDLTPQSVAASKPRPKLIDPHTGRSETFDAAFARARLPF